MCIRDRIMPIITAINIIIIIVFFKIIPPKLIEQMRSW